MIPQTTLNQMDIMMGAAVMVAVVAAVVLPSVAAIAYLLTAERAPRARTVHAAEPELGRVPAGAVAHS